MVRRGRDQAYTGGAVAGLCDPRIYFGTGQIAALTGLCALCQLDLDLFRRNEVFARYTKACGSHLLDLGIALAVVALFGFAALAGVAAAAQTVQGDGNGLMEIGRASCRERV